MKNISLYITIVIFLSFSLKFIYAGTPQKTINALLEKAEKELYTSPQQAAYYATKARTETDSPLLRAQSLYIYAQAEKLLGDFDGCKPCMKQMSYYLRTTRS